MEAYVLCHALSTLLPEKAPLYPMNRRLGGPQIGLGYIGEDKNLIPMQAVEP
jgi:hypothetical protein